MKITGSLFGALLVLGAFVLYVQAQEKEITLKGKIVCAKCTLKEGDTCVTALVVKEGDKEVTYYFKDKGADETYHEEICGGEGKEGTVTGTVAEKDGKKWLTPKKVEYTKK